MKFILVESFLTTFNGICRKGEQKKASICYGETYVVISFYFSIFDDFVCGSQNSVCCIYVRVTPNVVVIITISVAVAWPVVFSHP